MGAIEWIPDFNTGIAAIDEQHKRIILYINKLEQSSKLDNEDEVRNVINGLVDYTITHFEFEEELQEQAGYPFIKAHKKVHGIFKKRISTFVTRLDNGEDIVPELLPMLKTWLVSHIKSDDKDFVEAVNKKLESENARNTDWLSATVRRMFGAQTPASNRQA